MVDEYLTMYQAGIAGLILVAASFMYSWGGRSGKWKRRFIGSAILAAGVNGLCVWRGIWSPYMLIVLPCLIGGFSLGYGADTLGGKILRRSIYCLGVLMSGVVMAVVLGGHAYWVLIPHVGIGAFSIYMGSRNPIYASSEEFFICMMLNMGLLMFPFVS